jgi:hypothetical protein
MPRALSLAAAQLYLVRSMKRVAISVLLVVSGRLWADVRALPNLTADNLVGVWEAILSPGSAGMANAVYRMDIAKDSESYLTAVVGPAPIAVLFVVWLITS